MTDPMKAALADLGRAVLDSWAKKDAEILRLQSIIKNAATLIQGFHPGPYSPELAALMYVAKEIDLPIDDRFKSRCLLCRRPFTDDGGYQARVHDWMKECFQRPDAMLPAQRAFRFTEEALELAQASGTSREDVLRLVEYVFSRPPGVVAQELGGVMVTLSAMATSFGLSLEYAAEAELKRCQENTEKIRAKDLAKSERSPLPGSTETRVEGWTLECENCTAKILLPYTNAAKTHVDIRGTSGWELAPRHLCPECQTKSEGSN